MKHLTLVFTTATFLSAAASHAANPVNWPQFRGGSAAGVADRSSLPTRWSATENVAWVAEAPVIFSHSSARSLADHVRNVPDNILRLMPQDGGVVMVNIFPAFVNQTAARQAAGGHRRWSATTRVGRRSRANK